MKRKLWIFVVIILMFVNMLPAYAASEADFYVGTAQRIGIINGYADGSLRVDSFINRAEFAAIVYRVSTGKLSSQPTYYGPEVFKDITSGDWSYGYIYYCYNQNPKLLAGYPDGSFRPKNNITNAEAIKVFTQILYKGEEKLVFPYGYIAKAREIGLLSGLDKLDWIQPATRATVCKLAINALVSTNTSVSAQSAKLLTNLNIQTTKFKLIGVKGNHAEDFSFNQSFIAETSNVYGRQYLTAEYPYSVDDLIGYNVLIYYKDSNANNTLDTLSGNSIWSNGSMNQVNTPTETIIMVTETYNKTLSGKLADIKIFVSNTDGSFLYNNKEYFYSRDAIYIVNGKVIDKGTKGESRFEGLYGSAKGRFIMIDTNGDDVYDSCLIFTE